MITLNELLKNRVPDISNDTIIVRHKDNRYKIDMFDLIEKDYLKYYQSIQTKPIFDNKKYMIVFIGIEQSNALLYDIYKINGTKEYNINVFPEGYKKLFPDFTGEYKNAKWYNLEQLNEFDDLRQRVIIKWQNPVSWVQNYTEKELEIIEILPTGYVKDFTDYLDFTLTFNELKKMYKYQDANKRWIDKLSSVNGIYLILDKKTGNQYIGSGYGINGIWGRWNNYVKNYHGGNKQLIELLENDNKYYVNFQWTVLETLPANLSKEKIISFERRYKEKLGTKTFGLNSN